MKHFKVEEQTVIIAPKANKDVGRETTRIMKAESLADLLKSDGSGDENDGWIYYDPADTSKYAMTLKDFERHVKEIQDNNCVFFTNDSGEYWDTDPRSEDGYALDGVQITVTEMSEKDVEKYYAAEKKAEEAANKAKEEKRKKNSEDWEKLFYGAESLDDLLIILKQYNFPSKIKN